MVVEDEDGIRRMVCRVLRKIGFEVSEARDGQEALEAARRMSTLDLVLTDVMMPSMGGPELVRRLRVLLPTLKVVFMSGHTFHRLDVETLNATVERYLPKPFTPDALRVVVERTLGATHGTGQPPGWGPPAHR